MFKKFKDKLAEEVKSSPQRLQQFAQAAQAAVTSASSSISDITNNDLFSIGDSDSATKSQSSSNSQQSTFRDVSPVYQASIQSGSDLGDGPIAQEEVQRQRRLSNSSFASDVSFRLPSYESPSMYHLQSDMEVSASEAEEKGFNGSIVNLDRVTKEQLYAAYRHTQDRCKKYKTQYADLARHYKLLERENAKARNVLVETQDKALRRISELREQCSLEQSAKAHLERALRIEIDEKNMKIHALSMKLNLLQGDHSGENIKSENKITNIEKESEVHLINLNDNEEELAREEMSTSEICALNTKLEKMEHLVNKYKDSLKISKEKNAQMTTEIQILSNDLTARCKEIEELKGVSIALTDSKKKVSELNDIIEELQNKCNSYEFTKNKETSILEINLQSAYEDISQLKSKIEELKKREEEYAISLAENKLSIHKELESKEAEIKSLKDSLADAQNEIQSLHIVINDYKSNTVKLESECLKLKTDINEFNVTRNKIMDVEVQLQELSQKCQSMESSKAKLYEQYKCLQLQMKQETAEKLAMIDRNTYLEDRNAQLIDENTRKCSQIVDLETKLSHCSNKDDDAKETDLNFQKEISVWKTKYENLEKEIQDEREELIKLQSEIEKMLRNYELLQTENLDLIHKNKNLKKENIALQEQVHNIGNLMKKNNEINNNFKELHEDLQIISDKTRSSLNFINNEVFSPLCDKILLINEIFKQETEKNDERYNNLKLSYDALEEKMLDISNKYTTTLREMQTIETKSNISNLSIEQYKSEILNMKEEMQRTIKQHKDSLNDKVVLEKEVDNLKRKVEHDAKHYIDIEKNLKILETANQNLRVQLKETENRLNLSNADLNKEKELCDEKVQNFARQYESSLKEISTLKEEIKKCKHKIAQDETNILLLDTNLKAEKAKYNEKVEENNILSSKYISVLNEDEDKKKYMKKLQDGIENLTQENLTLKNLNETISANVNKLEYEVNELRTSYTEVEKEKNIVKEKLEKNQLLIANKDSQTDIMKCHIDETDKEQKNKILFSTVENPIYAQEVLESNAIIVESASPQISNKLKEQDHCNAIEEKYNVLQNEYETLKEENRRLQSDVEGLQIYLTKISKENSALNDKLRDYFISGENMPEKNLHTNQDIEQYKTEIKAGKEKIDNLIRENTILIEENLELKDQIQSHSYNNSEMKSYPDDTEQELQIIRNKYRSLLDVKSNLEKKVIEVEQMNQSVNENNIQMQVDNEKLRLSNEKLERRLDEALVSLRHLHALQENTELEYLRNILYEYLTGSGTHSLTLAKVLSAIVKFNDSQTDLVLQKEKERQGFLRQLGLL